MYYLIYKTTNIINNKFYIGLHITNNIDDNYLGSGTILKKAIKKYGTENFKKDIIFIFDNKKEMIDKEIELVNDNFINRKDTYNLSKGGFGLSTLSDESRKIAIEKIKKSLSKLDLSIRSKKRIETLLKIDLNIFKKIGKKSSITQKLSYKNGYINPNQNLNKINIYNSNDEIIYVTKRIEFETFCDQNNLPKRCLIKSLHNNGEPIYQYLNPRNKKFEEFIGWYAAYENIEKINKYNYINNLSIKKQNIINKLKINSVFNNKDNRGKKPSGSYEIYNDKNELVYKFTNNLKNKLEEIKLPKNTFTYSYRKKKKISKGIYKNWYVLRLH